MENVTAAALRDLCDQLEIPVSPLFGKRGSRLIKKDYIYHIREHFNVQDKYLLFKLYPEFFQPMLCLKGDGDDVDSSWYEEPKYDGIRIIIEKYSGHLYAWSRLLDITECVPIKSDILSDLVDFLNFPDGLYDSEIILDKKYSVPILQNSSPTVMSDDRFLWDPVIILFDTLFQSLHKIWFEKSPLSKDSFRVKVFDCLGVEGSSYQHLSYLERRQRLESFSGWNDKVEFIESRPKSEELFSNDFVEGKVFKDPESTYDVSSKRSDRWIKQRLGLLSEWNVIVYDIIGDTLLDLCVKSKERDVILRLGMFNRNMVPFDVCKGDVVVVKSSGWLVGHGGHGDIKVLRKADSGADYSYSDSLIYWGRRVLLGI